MSWRTECGGLVAVLVVAVATSLGPAMAFAQAQDDVGRLEGVWVGPLKPPIGKEIRLVLRVEKEADGSFEATLDTPEQEAYGLAVEGVEVDGRSVHFTSKAVHAKFEGELNHEGTAIAGKWNQGLPRPVTFTKTDPATVPKPAPFEVPAELVGLWSGPLALPGGLEIRVVLNVRENAHGKRKAVLDSPDQQVSDLPINSLSLQDGELKFEMKPLRASFVGKRTEDGSAFEGTFTQAGQKTPLTLKKVAKIEMPKRPQNPIGPLPYDVEEVSYANNDANITLAGSLTLPRGAGPFPAVLLITGSGAQDRDESLLGHKPFLVLADSLTRRGIAVLRVDDRGVGGSSGGTMESTTADFASDALAGVAFLKGHAKIKPEAIGLVGHSEGGLVGPLAASQSHDVAFVVMLAGTGLPGIDIIRLQGRLILEAMGASPTAIKLQRELLDRAYALLKAESDPKAVEEKLKTLTQELLTNLSPEDRKAIEAEEKDASELAEASVKQLANPWFKFFLDYDPRDALRKLTCPVLVLNGEKDLQVPPAQNLPEIEKALKEAGNTRFVIKELPGLNHLFQSAKTGTPAEYAQIEETFNPEAMKIVADWILEQFGR
jgi:fermentation-respiration switch protein FrsA (DUF1100 family)